VRPTTVLSSAEKWAVVQCFERGTYKRVTARFWSWLQGKRKALTTFQVVPASFGSGTHRASGVEPGSPIFLVYVAYLVIYDSVYHRVVSGFGFWVPGSRFQVSGFGLRGEAT